METRRSSSITGLGALDGHAAGCLETRCLDVTTTGRGVRSVLVISASMGSDFVGRIFAHVVDVECRMGQPIPDNIINSRTQSPHGRNLNLSRGPDPRSHEPQNAAFHAAMRQMLGTGSGDV